MTKTFTCATCQFWQGQPGAYYGDCQMQVVYGRVAFDYQPCLYHSERGKQAEGAALLSEAIQQQSQTRGLTYQEWARRLGAGK